MQRSLLPDELPEIPGIRFSAKYLPAGSGIKIGGDWYDFFQLADGRLAFVIGDVVGRGVLAASVMAEIRTGLRAYMVQGHGLTKVLSMLNELLVSMGRRRGATLSIVALDPEAEELETVTAGHLPPLLIDPDGHARLLEQTPGLPVGVGGGKDYEAVRHPFPTGSGLLLYTDGLIERRDEPIDAGFERLTAAAQAAARLGDSPLADGVYRALLDETPLEDDVALLAIETLPLGRTIEMTLPARPGVLAGMRKTLARWLQTAGAGEDELFDLTLAISEAATNAIEHAYGAKEDGVHDLLRTRRATDHRHRSRRGALADHPAGRRRQGSGDHARPGGQRGNRQRQGRDHRDDDQEAQHAKHEPTGNREGRRGGGRPRRRVHRRGERGGHPGISSPTALGPDALSLIVDLSDTRFSTAPASTCCCASAIASTTAAPRLILVIPDGSPAEARGHDRRAAEGRSRSIPACVTPSARRRARATALG